MIAAAVDKIENEASPISSADLKAHLVGFARGLGFDSCRVAACAAPSHAREFHQWLREGAAGEMSYMERSEEKRYNPQKVLPGARLLAGGRGPQGRGYSYRAYRALRVGR
jgi:hypothetical protein